MTPLTPERLAAIRARTTMATVLLPDGDVLALLDAAEERDQLRIELAHAHLSVTEDADGLTCDICGAELRDWAAADHHVETEHERTP